jgi:uncharacterized protein (TIGR03083 family)
VSPGGGAGGAGGGRAGAGSGFGFARAIETIAADSRRLAEVVGSSDLEARVPSCPKWSVRDLAHHIGEVQWYWGENLRAQNADQRSGAELTALPEDTDLLAWLGWCTYSLLGALRASGPDAPCWAWWPEPHTSGAVGRHQAQEAAVHRWDAEGVDGAGAPLPADLAEDGVPEFMEIMVGSDLGSLPGVVTLTATDTGATWRVAGTGGAGRESELRAPASDLVLMLYRRLPVPDTTVVGDPMLVAALLSLADTS